MILTFASSLIFLEIRMIIQSFPEILQKLWSEWELRGIVLLSLCLQIVLLVLGRRRKYIVGTRFGFVIDSVVWAAYSSADQVATVSLGIISCSLANSSSDKSPKSTTATITAFWAPFLLLHLGGQENITAYSLNDNDGYSRQLLVFIIQVGVTFTIILRSWSNTLLEFLLLLVFISGILKIGERIWTLWSSSSDHFRNSLLSPPNAGPDYPDSIKKHNDGKNQGLNMEFRSKIEENSSFVIQVAANETNNGTQEAQPLLQVAIDMGTKKEVELLTDAYSLFDIFQCLYAELLISYRERQHGLSVLLDKYKSPQQVFKVIEIELGIMYDMLYTKASIAHSPIGLCFRLISFFCSALALGLFWKAIGGSEHDFSTTDVGITYLLLIVAVLIEICSSIMLIFSETSFLWLSRRDKKMGASMYRAISSPPLALIVGKRWSGNIGQLNLIDFCLQDKPANNCEKVLKFFQINEKLKISWQEVTDALKEQIMIRIKNKLNTSLIYEEPKQSLKEAINCVLEQNIYNPGDRLGLITMEEFDFNVLLLHIATDICYYSNSPSSSNNPEPHSVHKISKSLSDYMLYLLVMCPILLPKGIGEIRYRDTCAEAIRYFEQRIGIIARDKSKACGLLLGENTEIQPRLVKGDRSKSVLFNGVILAKRLQALGNKKWVVISQMWIEMLWYAAIQSEWKYHGQQLSKGGEFLTHVCLLLAHLGFNGQYKVPQGEAELVQIPQSS